VWGRDRGSDVCGTEEFSDVCPTISFFSSSQGREFKRMGHLLLVKPSGKNGYEVLLQRRGKHLREAYHWGIPGGGYDSPERYTLKNTSDVSVKWKIGRRAALREFIEECGGGYHPTLRRTRLTVGEIPELEIQSVTFDNVILPPGSLHILDCEELVTSFQVPYGTSGRHTSVFLYVMRDNTDSEFLNDWVPRAIPRYRCEVDESYQKPGCQYGYTWINLESILSNPTHPPVESSSMPMCEFVTNLFTLHADTIRESIFDADICLPSRKEKGGECCIGGKR
jgi:8-oxo-dGTP pyrophosphatase MutT (NUDIX family)